MDPYVEALLHELEHYERYGQEDRAEAVRAELERVGYEPEAETTATEGAPEKAVRPRARARKAT